MTKKATFVIAMFFAFAIGTLSQNGQEAAPSLNARATVDRIMHRALARCQGVENGVPRISWKSPSNEDFNEIKSLGENAINPLSEYIDAGGKGFAELMAVKFIIAIGGPSTREVLKRAVRPEHWDIARAQALSGLFLVSPSEARPLVLAALNDKSQVVQQRAHDLYQLYPTPK